MNQENMQAQYMEEDTIDLKELWQTIVQRKTIVFGVVLVVTLASLVYVWSLKLVQPLYEASALIEIGQSIEEKSGAVRYLDNVNNLKDIIERAMSITAVVPKRTNALLLLSSSNMQKELAEKELQSGIDFIMNRHKEMAADYTKVRMSQVIGEVQVVDVAKQPKKKLIVAVSFVSSLIFSLFLVFFLEFIQGGRKEEK
ncbi:MAG: hypothetical protein COB67_07165 [SAR324 cluster bacterium]|uniref:Polysaccharide chain length determinant N-terminal domain-containing protein n=1 Tax=SAR324 cluster bacterium TaxID=2024889 RepID=A0A2A4T4H5_9DELT|nr:MAG: hypothetical protein COB67_07165 [SAR324 cluster bacterium]